MIFSILVPVYKTEKYLVQCIDSLLNQSFGDYEIILYDDASPDNCGMICDEYALKNPNVVHVIHGKKNIGLLAGRMELVRHARGEYCIFVDSDDYVSDSYLKTIYDEICISRPDMVVFDFYYHYVFKVCGSYDKKHIGEGCVKRIESEHDMDDYFRQLATFQIHTIWRKAFKRHLWTEDDIDNDYKSIRVSEDMYCTLKISNHCKSVSILPDHLYYYRYGANSMSHAFDRKRIFDMYKTCQLLVDFLQAKGVLDMQVLSGIIKYAVTETMAYISSMPVKNIAKKELIEICKELSENDFFVFIFNTCMNDDLCKLTEDEGKLLIAIRKYDQCVIDQFVRNKALRKKTKNIVTHMVFK